MESYFIFATLDVDQSHQYGFRFPDVKPVILVEVSHVLANMRATANHLKIDQTFYEWTSFVLPESKDSIVIFAEWIVVSMYEGSSLHFIIDISI